MEAMNSASRVFISDFKPMNTKSEFKTETKPLVMNLSNTHSHASADQTALVVKEV